VQFKHIPVWFEAHKFQSLCILITSILRSDRVDRDAAAKTHLVVVTSSVHKNSMY